MFNRILIAGVGSLGSFFSYHLAKSGCVKELLLYDSDIVNEKNLINSLYNQNDIGQGKVYPIRNKILRDYKDIKVIVSKTNFIDHTIIPNNIDLIIDCTDNFNNRNNRVDVKMYFQYSDFLVLDCRKNITYKPLVNTRYSVELSKSKIEMAALMATQYFESGMIKELVDLKKLYSIDLDLTKSDFYEFKNYNDGVNVIFESHDSDEILEDLDLHVSDIIERNKKFPILFSLKDEKKENIKEIRMTQLKDVDDVREQILSMLIDKNMTYRVCMPLARQNKYLVKIITQTISA
jgi:hypothetical protein